MTVLVILLAVVVGLFTILVIGVLRSHADIIRALHGLGITEEQLAGEALTRPVEAMPVERKLAQGVPQPRSTGAGAAVDFSGHTPAGDAIAVSVQGDRRTLLAFLSSGCETCQGFWQAFAEPGLQMPDANTRLVIVTQGADGDSPSAIADLAPADTITVMSTHAWDQYRVPASPYFILVDGTVPEVIGEGAALKWDQVSSMLVQAMADQGIMPVSGQSSTARLANTNAELEAANIAPGDPSLHEPHDHSH